MKDPANEIVEIAPTLEQLRKLPIEQKSRLFLARLARFGRNDSSALNKHNLTLTGDPYGVAFGYPEPEKRAVIEHLLAAPWIKLVNEGYLVDLSGQGFHKISPEGEEYLAAPPPPPAPAPIPAPVLAPVATTESVPPRAFISYAWEGPEHQAWVTALAERLQGKSGVEIIYDQWGLPPGADKQHFMEQSVRTQDFVIIICTAIYADRANKRIGGVGIETNIITGELAGDLLSKKFIPVLREGTFNDSLPSYIKTKMGVDLRGDPYSEAEYNRLIRVLHGEPIQGPPIAPRPDFSKTQPAAAPKAKTWLQAAGETLAERNAGTLLGPLKERPQAELHTQYDKPGTPGPWIYAIIRQWLIAGEIKYSLETSQGDEFLGTKDDVIETFSKFNRKMLKEGYKRMSFMPGTDPEFQIL